MSPSCTSLRLLRTFGKKEVWNSASLNTPLCMRYIHQTQLVEVHTISITNLIIKQFNFDLPRDDLAICVFHTRIQPLYLTWFLFTFFYCDIWISYMKYNFISKKKMMNFLKFLSYRMSLEFSILLIYTYSIICFGIIWWIYLFFVVCGLIYWFHYLSD